MPCAEVHVRAQGPVSRKPRKLFGPVKPYLAHLYLTTEKCIRLKVLVWRDPLFIIRLCEVNKTTLIIRFEDLLWLYGPEKFPGLLRNGLQACLGNVTVASCIENSFHKSIYNTHLNCWPCLEKRGDKINEPQMERKTTAKTTMNLVTSSLMTLTKIFVYNPVVLQIHQNTD